MSSHDPAGAPGTHLPGDGSTPATTSRAGDPVVQRELPPEWTPDIPGVRTARQIAAAAGTAARAWAQPLPAAELPVITACLDMAMLELSGALGQLAQYRTLPRPGTTYRSPFEPGIHISAAAQAIACISQDLRDAAGHQARAGESQPVTAAISAARALADATYAAFTEVRQPAGSLPARDAAVSAFMHATGNIDTAIGNLASSAAGPLAAILTRQRIRLEHACRSLREALVASAASQDDQPSLAAAARVRELHPILPHRSLPRPSAPHHAAIPPAAVMPRPRFLQANPR